MPRRKRSNPLTAHELAALEQVLLRPCWDVRPKTDRVWRGNGAEPDDLGLDSPVLFRGDVDRKERLRQLCDAMSTALRNGYRPEVFESAGDVEMELDNSVDFDWRLELRHVRIYVKSEFDRTNPSNVTLWIRSVKRAN